MYTTYNALRELYLNYLGIYHIWYRAWRNYKQLCVYHNTWPSGNSITNMLEFPQGSVCGIYLIVLEFPQGLVSNIDQALRELQHNKIYTTYSALGELQHNYAYTAYRALRELRSQVCIYRIQGPEGTPASGPWKSLLLCAADYVAYSRCNTRSDKAQRWVPRGNVSVYELSSCWSQPTGTINTNNKYSLLMHCPSTLTITLLL